METQKANFLLYLFSGKIVKPSGNQDLNTYTENIPYILHSNLKFLEVYIWEQHLFFFLLFCGGVIKNTCDLALPDMLSKCASPTSLTPLIESGAKIDLLSRSLKHSCCSFEPFLFLSTILKYFLSSNVCFTDSSLIKWTHLSSAGHLKIFRTYIQMTQLLVHKNRII